MRRTAAIAIVLMGANSQAMASEWVGQWGSPDCARDAMIIGLSPRGLDLSTFETHCQSVRSKKQPGGYELTAQCSGEGRPMRVSFFIRVDANELTFTRIRGFDFDPKRFRRCS